jgi:uncharacterized protein
MLSNSSDSRNTLTQRAFRESVPKRTCYREVAGSKLAFTRLAVFYDHSRSIPPRGDDEVWPEPGNLGTRGIRQAPQSGAPLFIMNQAIPFKDWLVVLAKEPVAGQAKTRLARDIGKTDAQHLAEAFALDTLNMATDFPGTGVLVAYAPAEGRDWFQRNAPSAELFCQPEGTFGPRIHSATRNAFRLGASRCVLIGMDTPHLEQETLRNAFDALKQSDVCLGPSADGGYYLIGLRSDQPHLFEDIPWSTDAAHSVTLDRAREAGLSVTELQVELDVDEGTDLLGLAAVLRERPSVAQLTRAAMKRVQLDSI